MQKKQQLLSQLDNALKRKVQQKYLKTTKAQDEQALHQEFYGGQAERNKFNSKHDQRNTANNYGGYTSKSPLISQKQGIAQAKSHQNINLKLSSNALQSPKLKSERQVQAHLPLEPSNITLNSKQEQITSAKMMEEIKRLRTKNAILENELKDLKHNIAQLEEESKALKRQESEYLSLKQENSSLVKQISFLRLKNGENKNTKQNCNVDINYLQEELKKILFQLNISSIFKHDSGQKFITQSLQNINHGIARLSQQKNKISAKLNNFDIETLLLKQNNTAYRKQLQVLRNENEQLQVLIEQNCNKIQETQSQLEASHQQKKKLQNRVKQLSKELEGLKREFKMSIEASKYSKPKREHSAVRPNKQIIIQASVSVVKTFNNQESQTEVQVDLLEHSVNINSKQIQQQLEMQIQALLQNIESLEQNNLRNDIEKSKLEQNIYKYEQYIKELQLKSQEIKKDLANFMPQLKQIEEDNNKLKQENKFKDTLIEQKQRAIAKLKISLEEAKDKASTIELQAKQQIFEKQLLKTEIQKLNSQIMFLTSNLNQLDNALLENNKQINRTILQYSQKQSEQSLQIQQLQKIINHKNHQIEKITKDCLDQAHQFIAKIQRLEAASKVAENINSKIFDQQSQFAKIKLEIEDKVNRLQSALDFTQKQNQQYVHKQKQYEQSFKKYELQTNNLLESYSALEKDNSSLLVQRSKLEQANQTLALKIDELTKQMFGYKCDIQRLTFDNKNNAQLKEYYQQVSNELKSKLEQLIKQITKVECQKSELMEKQVSIENNSQQFSIRQAQIVTNLENKDKECEELKGQLRRLSEEYHCLSEELARFREESGRLDRSRLEQISLQNYDIERLMRESNELKLRLQHLSTLRESNLFRSSEADQRMAALLEENKDLARKNEMLMEELSMKQASSEEDQYLNQLKNRQYCILLKKLLSCFTDSEDLDHYQRFEELLEIGAEMAVKRKMMIREEQSERRRNGRSEYEMEYVSEPIKRFYIGTQISSSQQLVGGVHTETDQILEMESNINKNVKQEVESPRSFRFQLSPNGERKQKRTSRLISYFNNTPENHSKLSENKDMHH